MLQRHEPEAEQPVGRARDVLGDGTVRLARGPRGELLARPRVVVRRRRRHDLHVDALPVHLGEARVERREQRHPLADHAARCGEALGAVAAGLERLRRGEPLGVACADRLLQRRQQQVRVHVDDGLGRVAWVSALMPARSRASRCGA